MRAGGGYVRLMPRSVDETRREFLVRLAKASAFVPPAVLTLGVERVYGQKGGKNAPTTVTGLSGTSSAFVISDRDALRKAGRVRGPTGTSPRGAVPGGVQAPWQRRPPTTGGG